LKIVNSDTSEEIKQLSTLSIVIVNWNTGDLLRKCINSLNEVCINNFKFEEIIIVDNNSTDESLKDINFKLGNLRIIQNDKNLGFAKACNQGGFSTQSEYILFLNPDTKIEKNSLSKVISFMSLKSSNEIGICGTYLYGENNKFSISAAKFPTFKILLNEILGFSKVLPKIFESHLLNEEESCSSGLVEQIIGAFFFVRSKVFMELNGFDERFFVYFEEVDFSKRAAEKGYFSYLMSDVSNYHLGGGSSNNVVGKRLFYSISSRLKYTKKHFKYYQHIFIFLLSLFVEPVVRLFYLIASLNFKDILSLFYGYMSLFKSLFIREK